MQVDNPSHQVDSTTDFNVNFYKDVNSEGLTLSKAKKYFVQLNGMNIIYAYNILKSLLYSENTIASNIIQCQKIVTDELVCNKITTKITQQNNICGCTIYFDGLNIMLYSETNKISEYKPDYINNLTIPNTFKIIVNTQHIVVVYDNKRIIDVIKSTDKPTYKFVKYKNFTHLTLKSIK